MSLLRRHIVALIAAALAFGVIWLATMPPALGLTTDSAQYVAAAQSFVQSGRLEVPTLSWLRPDSASALKHYPPGVSVAIAGVMVLGADVTDAARFVIAISVAIWMAIAVTLIQRTTATRPAMLTAAALFAMPSTIFVHQYVMSEPLYLAVMLVTMYVMWARPSDPLWYGLGAAACSLVRYAGLAMIIAAGVWALLQGGSLSTRLRRGLVAGLPSLVLQGIWQYRITRSGQDIAPLTNPGGWGAEIVRTVGSLTRWLAPGIDGYAVRVLVAVGLAGWTLWVLWRHRGVLKENIAVDPARHRFLAVISLVIACHLGVLLVLRATTYVIPFDLRILAPILLLVVMLAGVALALLWPTLSPGVRRVTGAAIAVWIVAGAVTSTAMLNDARRAGLEYGEQRRRTSASIRWIREHGASRVFFTNAHATLYFNAGRHAYSLPLQWSAPELSAFADSVRRRRGLIAIFTYPSGKVPAAQALIEQLPATPVASFDDAVIWELRDPVGDERRSEDSGQSAAPSAPRGGERPE